MRWTAYGCRCLKSKSRMRQFALAMGLFANAMAAQADQILSAAYVTPTGAYGHGVLPGGEYAALEITTDTGVTTIRYGDAVFEDTAPRVVDLDGDGQPEVVTVVSTFTQGARVQVFGVVDDAVAPVLNTAPIGQRNRWLAIAGIADLDGDGQVEIAYVDRPHLARTLRVLEVARAGGLWTFRDEGALEGVTNHRIGEADIAGGVRTCAGAPEIVVARADWSALLAVRFDGGFTSRVLGQDTSRPAFAAAMTCSD